MTPKCICPQAWYEIVGIECCENTECPAYSSCGGWTWDPPCGGCDSCIMAQHVYCDDGSMTARFNAFWAWRNLQVMCA